MATDHQDARTAVRRASFALGLGVAALALIAQPAPSHASPERLSALTPFLGTWQGQGKLFRADATFRMQWRWVLGDQFLHLTFENRVPSPEGGDRVFRAQAFYRPVGDGKLEGTWFDSRGVVQPLKGVVEAGALTAHWGTEETERGRTVYRISENGRVDVKDFVLKGEEWAQFGHAIYQRVPGMSMD